MNKTILKITLCAIALMPTAMAAYSQRSKPNPDLDYIKTKKIRLFNYRRDFVDFARSNSRESIEVDTALDLAEIADTVFDYLGSIETLVIISDRMSCKKDKELVGIWAKLQIDYDANQIVLKIEGVNHNLAYTKIPAIAVSGTQLKDELREIQDRLRAIKLN